MNHADFLSKVEFIQKQFFSGLPLKELNWQNIFENINWEQQAILITSTLQHPLNLKYPLRISYQKAFTKLLIEKFESLNEVNDLIHEIYVNLLNFDEDRTEFFKHFILTDSKRTITIQENKSYISEGTTGLCTWPASYALSEHCIQNSDTFTGKKVLELGSGTGLTGLSVILKCAPSEFVFSDCHSSVLNILCANLKLNLKNCLSDNKIFGTENKILFEKIYDKNTKVRVCCLPWENIGVSDLCETFKPDVVIGADIVFDSSCFESLVSALLFFFGKNPECFALFACTVRNSSTLEEFLELLEKCDLTAEDLNLCESKTFFWSKVSPIRLLRITKL